MAKKEAPLVRDPGNRFERDAHNVIDGLSKTPVVQGNLLTDIVLSASTTNVPHGLSRVPRGWIIVDRNAGQAVFRDTTVTTQRDKFLALKAAGAVTVSIWVF